MRSIASPLEARFKALADAQPPLLNAEIQSRLHQNPPIDPNVSYGWLVQHLSAQAEQELSGDPITSALMSELLRQTKHDDPESMCKLIDSLNSITGVAALPLGSYTPLDGSKPFCFLQPQLGLLPRDFEPSPSRGDAVVMQAKCMPPEPSIPVFFLETGQLQVATFATATLDETNSTAFWLAFWNPLGSDPQNQSIYPPSGVVDWLGPHLVAGQLSGFTAQCTAVSFNLTIDHLLQNDQAKWTRTIDAINFLSLPMYGAIAFGGADNDGWTRLNRVSSQFATVPSYDAIPSMSHFRGDLGAPLLDSTG